MAIAYSYPQGTPKLTDTLIGVQYETNKDPAVKQFSINDIVDLVPVVYTTLPYKVYTALLTQSGGDAPAICYGDGGEIEKGFTYTISANPDNYDLTIYGASNNEVGTNFVSNQTIILSYTISLELSYNEGAPVVTVLENTIGNIWFSYGSVGMYNLNSDNLFELNKTASFIGGDGATALSAYRIDNNIVEIFTYNLNTSSNEDGLLENTSIEIRVYN
jgi:hypothetical protein